MTGTPELDQRLDDAQRKAVVEALGTHRAAGRLSTEELEDRQLVVASAQTWSDVVPLFADLPAPYPAGMPDAGRPDPAAIAAAGISAEGVSADDRPSNAFGLTDVQRNAVVTLVALGATVLFFTEGSWLWFLAVPAAAALLRWFDSDDKPERPKRERERERNRDRDRRRDRG